MAMSIKDNPIYERLTRNARWPSLRLCLWLAGGLGVVSLVISLLDLLSVLNPEVGGSLYSPFVMFLAWLLAIICPVIVSLIAVGQTSRDVQSEGYRLVSLTLVNRTQIMRGYVLAALHRVRVLLAMVVGLSPVMIGGPLVATLFVLSMQLFTGHESLFLPETADFWGGASYPPNTLDVVGLLVEIAAPVIGMLLVNLLAAVVGVALALWWRRATAAASAVASLSGLAGSLAGVIAVLTMIGPSLGGLGFSQLPNPWLELVLVSLLCMVPPVLLATGIMVLARRWV
jgi:hypothetical protein